MATKQTAPRRKAQAYPDPGNLPLPTVEVEADPRRGGDPDFEALDSVLADLLGSAWPAHARMLDEFLRLKRRVADLLPRPRRERSGERKVRKLEHPKPLRPGTGYAVEESAFREHYQLCLHVQADRLRSHERRDHAHAAIDALFACDIRGAEAHVFQLIDQAVELVKATDGRRDPARTRLLLRDLERLRSFLLPIDRPHFDITDQEKPTSSADVVADLRQRREDLLEDRVAAYHGLAPSGRRIIAASVAAREYHVSVEHISVLVRCRKLTAHRPPGHPRNSPLLVDEDEIARRFQRQG